MSCGVKEFLVDLNMQRLKKLPVICSDLRATLVASRQADGRVKFQYDVESGCSHLRNRIRNAWGIRHRVVDGMAEFA